MSKSKYHRGQMSHQGKQFLNNIQENDVENVRKMFMQRFGKLLTDKTINKHLNKRVGFTSRDSKSRHLTADIAKLSPTYLTPERWRVNGDEVSFYSKDKEYTFPLKSFGSEFIVLLRREYLNKLKEEMESLNAV